MAKIVQPQERASAAGWSWIAIAIHKVLVLTAAGLFVDWSWPARRHGGETDQEPGVPFWDLPEGFAAWDATHYLALSQEGYTAGTRGCAFYPLWPALLKVVSLLTGDRPVLAGVLLANLLSAVALGLLARLMARHLGSKAARDGLILMLAFPGAFFLCFPYSEALFLLLVAVFFDGLASQRWRPVALAGFLLPLTRPVGILILPCLTWALWEVQRGVAQGRGGLGRDVWGGAPKEGGPGTAGSGSSSKRERRRSWLGSVRGSRWLRPVRSKENGFLDLHGRAMKGRWVALAAPLAGYGLYFLVMFLWTGDAWAGFEAQRLFPAAPRIQMLVDFPAVVRAFLNLGSWDGMEDAVWDRALFVLFLAGLPLIWRVNRTWFWYALPMGLVPALTSSFMSFRRYLLVVVPLFFVGARWLVLVKGRGWFWYYVAVLGALQLWAVRQFVRWQWAG